MSSTIDPAALLRQQISDHEQAVQTLRKQIAELEQADKAELQPDKSDVGSSWPFSPEEYSRYGRQMIVPSVGLKGKSSTYYILRRKP
jgi:adenylyltransferase/sulfurtransferase